MRRIKAEPGKSLEKGTEGSCTVRSPVVTSKKASQRKTVTRRVRGVSSRAVFEDITSCAGDMTKALVHYQGGEQEQPLSMSKYSKVVGLRV